MTEYRLVVMFTPNEMKDRILPMKKGRQQSIDRANEIEAKRDGPQLGLYSLVSRVKIQTREVSRWTELKP